MFGSLVTAIERDSGVDVVHGCFPERGDFIKSLLLGALASEAAKQLKSFSS